MTLSYEQYHALTNTRAFLVSLLNPKETPTVPKAIRELARRHLKHYPAEYEACEMVRVVVEASDTGSQSSDPVGYSPRHGGWVWWDRYNNPSSSFLSRVEAECAYRSYEKTL